MDLQLHKLKTENLTCFAGFDTDEITQKSLLWANKLAENEKVAFLSWCSYYQQLEQKLQAENCTINKNLMINTSLDFFCVSSFIEVCELIKSENIKTVFFDDLNSIYHHSEGYCNEVQDLINVFLFIAETYNVKIIVNTLCYLENKFSENIRDYDLPRMIVNLFDNIYVLPPVINDEFDYETGSYIKQKREIITLKCL